MYIEMYMYYKYKTIFLKWKNEVGNSKNGCAIVVRYIHVQVHVYCITNEAIGYLQTNNNILIT